MILDFTILKQIRKANKIQLQKLSKETSISLPTLINLEKNRSNVTLDTLKKISKYFDLKVWELVYLCETASISNKIIEKMSAKEFLKLIGV